MRQIIERELSHLTSCEIARLREMLVNEENTYRISEITGVSKCVIGLIRHNFPLFIRLTEEKKSSLRLVYVKAA